jgi:hypothetical protein
MGSEIIQKTMEGLSRNESIQDQEPAKYIRAGQSLEEMFSAPVDCGWDGSELIEAKEKKDEKHASEIVERWVGDHVMPYKEWNRLPAAEKQNAVIEWVKQHQPAVETGTEEMWETDAPDGSKKNVKVIVDKKVVPWDAGEPPISIAVIGGREVANPLVWQLHGAIAAALDLEDFSELKFYTALGTPVDTLYGVDAFVEYGGLRFTLDITMDREKIEGRKKSKADYLIALENIDRDGNYTLISMSDAEAEGEKIAKKIKQRLEMEEIRRERGLAA